MYEVLKEVSFNDVIPYDKNYLNHEKNIDHIYNSIRDFGYNKVSVGIDENNIMLYGHGTLEVLKKLDYKHIPLVLRRVGLTKEQKHAYRIADNASAKKASVIVENLKLEIQEIENFKLEDYGFNTEIELLDINDLNNMNENDTWVQNDMPEFKGEDQKYKIIYLFDTELERNAYAQNNDITIGKKSTDFNWICYK